MEIDTGFVTLVLGFVGVIILTALIGVILWVRRTSHVRIPAHRLTSVEITFAPDEREAIGAFVSRVRASQPGILLLGYAAPGVVTDAVDYTPVREPGELIAAAIAPLAVS